MKKVEQPLVGVQGILLGNTCLDFQEPLAVEDLLRADRRRDDERNSKPAVEGQLARLGPEDVRLPQRSREQREVPAFVLRVDDPNLRAPRQQLVLGPFEEAAHLLPDPCHQVHPDRTET